MGPQNVHFFIVKNCFCLAHLMYAEVGVIIQAHRGSLSVFVCSLVRFSQLAVLLPLMIIMKVNAVHCKFLPESTSQVPFNITANLQAA